MPIIESPVKHWPGTVTLLDQLTMPQVLIFERVLAESGEFFEDKDGERVLKANTMWGAPDAKRIEGILACVEEWDLENFPDEVTVETFPATPRTSSHALISWLFGEIVKLYIGEVEIPNE